MAFLLLLISVYTFDSLFYLLLYVSRPLSLSLDGGGYVLAMGRYNNVTGQTSYQQTYGAATAGYTTGAMMPQQPTQVPMQPVYQQPMPVRKTSPAGIL